MQADQHVLSKPLAIGNSLYLHDVLYFCGDDFHGLQRNVVGR